jgi:hypothetical protein
VTIEEFNATRWGSGMKCRVTKEDSVYSIVSVNFSEALIGVCYCDDDSDLAWYRCESLELV